MTRQGTSPPWRRPEPDPDARYIRDVNPGAFAVRVQCLGCGKMVLLARAIVDRKGPAFRGYFHDTCAPEGARLEAGPDLQSYLGRFHH